MTRPAPLWLQVLHWALVAAFCVLVWVEVGKVIAEWWPL